MAWSQQVVDRLAESCEAVAVLTQRLGRYSPPPNVQVAVMPLARLMAVPLGTALLDLLVNRQAHALAVRHRVDVCFIHMAIHWANALSPTFRRLRLPVLVWYAHGSVTPELRRAHDAATRIVTSTTGGCRLESDKIRVIGQGVDTDLFQLQPLEAERNDVLAVTRLSRRKRLDRLLDAMDALRRLPGGAAIRLRVIGAAITREDRRYETMLRERLRRENLEGSVEFAGFVPQAEIPARYHRRAFLHINLSSTGSMDKTVVEALATGCPVVTSNDAFRDLLAQYPQFVLHDDAPLTVARRVLELYAARDEFDRAALRALVVGRHDIHSFTRRLLANLDDISGSRSPAPVNL
jgi:glycosyltransferase involved in cell wall biosynthesis